MEWVGQIFAKAKTGLSTTSSNEWFKPLVTGNVSIPFACFASSWKISLCYINFSTLVSRAIESFLAIYLLIPLFPFKKEIPNWPIHKYIFFIFLKRRKQNFKFIKTFQ